MQYWDILGLEADSFNFMAKKKEKFVKILKLLFPTL